MAFTLNGHRSSLVAPISVKLKGPRAAAGAADPDGGADVIDPDGSANGPWYIAIVPSNDIPGTRFRDVKKTRNRKATAYDPVYVKIVEDDTKLVDTFVTPTDYAAATHGAVTYAPTGKDIAHAFIVVSVSDAGDPNQSTSILNPASAWRATIGFAFFTLGLALADIAQLKIFYGNQLAPAVVNDNYINSGWILDTIIVVFCLLDALVGWCYQNRANNNLDYCCGAGGEMNYCDKAIGVVFTIFTVAFLAIRISITSYVTGTTSTDQALSITGVVTSAANFIFSGYGLAFNKV